MITKRITVRISSLCCWTSRTVVFKDVFKEMLFSSLDKLFPANLLASSGLIAELTVVEMWLLVFINNLYLSIFSQVQIFSLVTQVLKMKRFWSLTFSWTFFFPPRWSWNNRRWTSFICGEALKETKNKTKWPNLSVCVSVRRSEMMIRTWMILGAQTMNGRLRERSRAAEATAQGVCCWYMKPGCSGQHVIPLSSPRGRVGKELRTVNIEKDRSGGMQHEVQGPTMALL